MDMTSEKPQIFFEQAEPIATIHYCFDKDTYRDLSEQYHRSFITALYKKYALGQSIFYLALAIFIGLLLSGRFLPEPLLDYQQIGLIVSFTLFALIGAIKLGWFLGIRRVKKQRTRIAASCDFSQPFEYQIYTDQISINEPYQRGTFKWSDFEDIDCYNDLVVFIFATNKTAECAKLYRVIIPIHLFFSHEKVFTHLRKQENFNQYP